jgi:SAM-dependent methyltransferase
VAEINKKMNNYDLRNAPKCPFGNLRWHQYYWVFPREAVDYDDGYWTETIDPDGKPRNMLSEAERLKQVAELDFIIKRIHAREPGRLLDVGCGPGHLLSAIDDKWEKHGVDVSRTALDMARPFAQVEKGEFPNLDFPCDHFDVVVLHHVIEHLANPVDYIRKARAVLKKGGLAIVSTPDFDSGCARWFKLNYRMLHDKGHISLFTHFSVVGMMEDFHFRVLEVEYPFFETRWFSGENLLRLFDTDKISPPFYGNHLTVFAEKQ